MPNLLKLFCELMINDLFYFGDNPNRILIKSDNSHYISPEGRRVIDVFVAVFKKQ